MRALGRKVASTLIGPSIPASWMYGLGWMDPTPATFPRLARALARSNLFIILTNLAGNEKGRCGAVGGEREQVCGSLSAARSFHTHNGGLDGRRVGRVLAAAAAPNALANGGRYEIGGAHYSTKCMRRTRTNLMPGCLRYVYACGRLAGENWNRTHIARERERTKVEQSVGLACVRRS